MSKRDDNRRGRGRNQEGNSANPRRPHEPQRPPWGQQSSASSGGGGGGNNTGNGRQQSSGPPAASAWGPPLGGGRARQAQPAQAPAESAAPSAWGQASQTSAKPAAPSAWGQASQTPAQPAAPSAWGQASQTPTQPAAPSAWGQASQTPAQPAAPSAWGQASGSGAVARDSARAGGRPGPQSHPRTNQSHGSDASSSSAKRPADEKSDENRTKFHADKTRGEAARGAIHGNRSSRGVENIIVTRPEHINSKKGAIGQQIVLKSNYFRFFSLIDALAIYQYHVEFRPEIENPRMRMALIAQHRSHFGGHCFDGMKIFSIVKLPKDVTEFMTRSREGEEILIIIKFVGMISSNESTAIQVHNLILRRIMQGLNLNLVGRNYFDSEAKINVPEHKLEIWPGYVTSIRQHEQSLMMMAEIQFKLMRSETVYEILHKCLNQHQNWQPEFLRIVLGMTVLTKYNNRTYRIDDVQFESSPSDTFDGKTGPVTYVEYYQQRYGIRIRDPKQPLLLSRPRERDIRGGRAGLIFLIPELCSATGYTDAMRTDFRAMQTIAQHTRVNPTGRIQRLLDFNARLLRTEVSANAFRDWGLDIERQLVDVPGRILPIENIIFGQKRNFAPVKADWTRGLTSNPMFTVCELKNWYVVVPHRLKQVTIEFIRCFLQAARCMNYAVTEPIYEPIGDDNRTATYTNALDQISKANPMFIMCIVQNNQADRYSAIKKKLFTKLSINCQVMTARTMQPKNPRNLMSVATKVVVQVNSKLGGAPWMVNIPINGLMVVGFDVYHDSTDKSRSFGALVGSMDLKLTQRFYSMVTAHRDGQELSNELGMGMTKLLHQYVRTQGALPERIILYRDGVGEGQTNYVYEHEVQECLKVLDRAYEKRETKARFAFVVVSKRINTKFFKIAGNEADNPPPGTVVDDVVTLPERYDFFIVAQAVTQGTATPTNYNVLYDTFGFPPERIQQLTYKMCHLYYNWSGTVRVPAVCQYAHKLAYLVGQYLHEAPRPELESYLYYL